MTTAYVTHPRYLEHDLPGHPEHAGRLRAIWRQLDDAGLTARMNKIEPDPVGEAMLETVHSPDYLQRLASTARQKYLMHLDPDTYAVPTSYEIARLAAGGVVRAVDEVLGGSAKNGLAVVRPPGHHAMPDRAMGFCLLGNVAIAARHAQRSHRLERVLIVDYDVHHGNGTQAMFYDDASVLFISTHQSPFYPGTGSLDEIGSGKGTGFTVNIPLTSGHGDANYAALYEEIVWPLARRFQPELILVSAGFDAHWSDPLAGMRLTLPGYAHLSRALIEMAEELCGGKVVFVLEGGYHLEALAHGVRNLTHVLLGENTVSDPLGVDNSPYPEPMISPLIAQLKVIHGL